MDSKEHLVVAAIDFGTTYSGYAFSFLHDYKKDPTKCAMYTWTAGSGGLISLKTPSCILFDRNGIFDSCGFEAETKYADLALENKHADWLFFERFKMNLYKQIGLKRQFALEAENGKQMDAMKVFSEMINFFKNHLIKECEHKQTEVRESDIQFVITVPAIWTDPAKQFMREAAENAGIKKDNLLIALEPETASLFCKHLPIEKMVASESGYNVFSSGSTYIVLDAGGGTIDITVHEVQRNGTLKEIQKASGGNWGGTMVDKAFREFLEDIIGKNVMENFRRDQKYDYLDLFRDFEVKKRIIKPKSDDKLTLKYPISLSEIYKQLNHSQIKDDLDKKVKYKDQITLIGDKMRLRADLAKGFFSNAINHILQHMKQLLLCPGVSNASHILMVGGFSESPMLQDALKTAFPTKKFVIPNEAGLAVLKGAVIFGHEPSKIQYRVSKYTYGIRTCNKFDYSRHPVSRLLIPEDGNALCKGVFHKHVEIDQQIQIGVPQSKEGYSVVEKDQTSMAFPLYISKKRNPKYVDNVDENDDDDYSDSELIDDCGEKKKCIRLGSLEITVPGNGLGRSAKVAMTFSGTELTVEAWNEHGERTEASFDLLK